MIIRGMTCDIDLLTLNISSKHLGSKEFLNLYMKVPMLYIEIFSRLNNKYLLNNGSVDVYGGAESIKRTAFFCIFTTDLRCICAQFPHTDTT